MTLEGIFERFMKIVTKGCPQGSVLGPEFWNMVFDELLKILESIDCEIILPGKEIEVEVLAYADHLGALICADSRNALEIAAKHIGRVNLDWCKSVKMTLATEKTEVLMLKGKMATSPSRVVVGDRVIPDSDKVKVVLGKNGSISGHTAQVTAKASRTTAVLTGVAKAEWGMDYRCLRTLYSSLYLSIAT